MENINIPPMAANLPMMQPNPMYHAPAMMPLPAYHEPMHLHGYHHKMHACAPAPIFGGFTTTAVILVLFILLVIVSRSRVFSL